MVMRIKVEKKQKCSWRRIFPITWTACNLCKYEYRWQIGYRLTWLTSPYTASCADVCSRCAVSPEDAEQKYDSYIAEKEKQEKESEK